MSKRIPDGKTSLLLVEGNDEKQFFIQLGLHLFNGSVPYHIMEYKGVDRLGNFLALLRNTPNFASVESVGIVRDADYAGDPFARVQQALRDANTEPSPYRTLSVPAEPESFADDALRVGVFIMPNANESGMLETLIMQALQDDAIMPCVDAYFGCLRDTGMSLKQEAVPKATMRVYMAGLRQAEMRTFIEGKKVSVDSSGSDRNRSYLSDIYQMRWWTWEHEAFQPIWAFLAQLGRVDNA